MNYEITKELLAEQQARFKDIDDQLALINEAIQSLETEKATVESKTFFVGKAKKIAELKGELVEAANEKASLLNKREGLLLTAGEVNTLIDQMAVKCDERFNDEIMNEFKSHIAAINELVKKGSDLDSQLLSEIRSDIHELAPYLDKEAQKQLEAQMLYRRFDSDMTHEIHQISDLALHGWA